jgi:3-deoxy-D-manno-octulosonic-acid transferase
MADAGLAVMLANQGALQKLLDGIGRLLSIR